MAEKETAAISMFTQDNSIIPPITLNIPMPPGAAIPPYSANSETASTNNK